MTHVDKPRVVLVLGMHRSGTSALAGTLALAGIYPGPSPVAGVEGVNPKGFWEHRDIVDVHERLLESMGSAWHDERPLPEKWWCLPQVMSFREELMVIVRRDFANYAVWLLKDPRICRLLPLWLDILAELGISPHFILMLRHPLEVARSLQMRDGIARERGCLIWLDHLLRSQQDTYGYPRSFVTYQGLLDNRRRELSRLAMEMSLELICSNQCKSAIKKFIEPDLRHHRISENELVHEKGVLSLAQEAYAVVSSNEDPDAWRNLLDPIGVECNDTIASVRGWSDEIISLHRRVSELDRENADLIAKNTQLIVTIEQWKYELMRVQSTVSWRVTKPLRLVGYMIRRFVGFFRPTP